MHHNYYAIPEGGLLPSVQSVEVLFVPVPDTLSLRLYFEGGGTERNTINIAYIARCYY